MKKKLLVFCFVCFCNAAASDAYTLEMYFCEIKNIPDWQEHKCYLKSMNILAAPFFAKNIFKDLERADELHDCLDFYHTHILPKYCKTYINTIVDKHGDEFISMLSDYESDVLIDFTEFF